MTNLEYIQTHIEASAPCSLFSAAAWVEKQLSMPLSGFVAALDTLAAQGIIELSSDDSGITIDLI